MRAAQPSVCLDSHSTHRHGDLSQDVLGDGPALLDHLLVELIEGGVHQLHADPDVTLATDSQVWKKTRKSTDKATGRIPIRQEASDFPVFQSQRGNPEHPVTAAGSDLQPKLFRCVFHLRPVCH